MPMPIRALVPYAFVQSVPASIDFYSKIGFTAAKTFTPPGGGEPSWAWLQSGDAALMIERASHPIVASEQAVILVLYVEDVLIKHSELQSAGVSVGPIERPFDSPNGKFRLTDPDGYDLTIRHA